MISRGAMGAAFAGLLMATSLSACGGPDTVASDAVLAGYDNGFEGGTARTVVLPAGSMSVTIGEPTDEVSAKSASGPDKVQAPDGYAFLPVRWEFDSADAPLGMSMYADAQQPDVRLSVGEREWDLGSPYTVEGGKIERPHSDSVRFLVVPGTPSARDVDISVTYDGAALELQGDGSSSLRVSAMAELQGAEFTKVPCPARSARFEPAASATLTCDPIETVLSPYWPGRGWAPEGSQWRVVRVPLVLVGKLRMHDRDYVVEEVTGTLDGADLILHPTGNNGSARSVGGIVAIPDRGKDLELVINAHGMLAGPSGPPEFDTTSIRIPLALP